MKKTTRPAPTPEEILTYDNVLPEVAARFIGWSSTTICRALQQERAPFGMATINPETNTWAYNISPGLLIKYKNGELPTYRLKEVINLASEGVEQVINQKLSGLQKLLDTLAISA